MPQNLVRRARKEHIARGYETQLAAGKTELQGAIGRKAIKCAFDGLIRQADGDGAA
jgi:hypothetical protein